MKIAVIILVSFFIGLQSLLAQVVINEVFYDAVGGDTGKEWIELYNPSGSDVNLNGYDLCARSSGGDYTFGLFTLLSGSYVVVYWNKDGTNTATELYTGSLANISDSHGSVTLFNSTSHSSSTIIDFVEWGAGGQTFESTAVSAGIWTEDDFVPKVDPGHSMEYDGSGDTSLDWFDQQNPTPGGDNSLPVELSSFTASYFNNAVVLRWTTESELNNAGFFVLRADDENGPFSEVSSFVTGAGTSTEKHNYSYNDERIETDKTYWYQLKQINTDGTFQVYGPKKINVPQLNGNKQGALPTQSQLVGNYPNPFNPGTTISLTVGGENETATTIAVYDLLGQRVRTIIDQSMQPGFYELLWDGRNDFGLNVPGGAYFCKMFSAGGGVSMLKLLKMN